MDKRIEKFHKKHPTVRRALYSIAVILAVLAIGTVGFHCIEHYSYTYSFFYTSMLATGEGPATSPATQTGLLFASVMSFVSVGTVIIALAYLFGPFIGKFFRFSEKELKKEEKKLEREVEGSRES